MSISKVVFIVMISFLMIATTSFSSAVIGENSEVKKITSLETNSGPYEGRLRVYVVQPRSIWKNHDRAPYHFSLVDFPLITGLPFFTTKWDEDISIDYLDTYSKTVTWSGFASKNNVMVIAGVYDARSEIKYSYEDIPFYAHYLDAAAGARPGETAFNTVNQNFTHTVIVEVATETTCPNCPIMEEALYNLYKTGEYPFYFINMVLNRNRDALFFMFDHQEGYSQHVAPEAYFDGGYEMLVGGESDIGNYTSLINSSGKRDVHQLNLSLSVTWKGFGKLGISIDIKNNEEVHYPLKPVAPYSTTDKFLKGQDYTFESNTTDPDGDELYYMFEWGDGTNSGWVGPYHSGLDASATHSWSKRDFFDIRVMAKDINGEVSPRSERTIVEID
jgi:hypothetical protein